MSTRRQVRPVIQRDLIDGRFAFGEMNRRVEMRAAVLGRREVCSPRSNTPGVIPADTVSNANGAAVGQKSSSYRSGRQIHQLASGERGSAPLAAGAPALAPSTPASRSRSRREKRLASQTADGCLLLSVVVRHAGAVVASHDPCRPRSRLPRTRRHRHELVIVHARPNSWMLIARRGCCTHG